MASLPALEAAGVCPNSDNAHNLNHKNACSNGAFSLSFSLFVCGYVRVRMSMSVCVEAQDWCL